MNTSDAQDKLSPAYLADRFFAYITKDRPAPDLIDRIFRGEA